MAFTTPFYEIAAVRGIECPGPGSRVLSEFHYKRKSRAGQDKRKSRAGQGKICKKRNFRTAKQKQIVHFASPDRKGRRDAAPFTAFRPSQRLAPLEHFSPFLMGAGKAFSTTQKQPVRLDELSAWQREKDSSCPAGQAHAGAPVHLTASVAAQSGSLRQDGGARRRVRIHAALR